MEAETSSKRLNSVLESKGAKYLALGHLLIEAIPSDLIGERNQGHDIISVNPEDDRSCRIKVKSRWSALGSHKVYFRSLDFDFAVIVLLNRCNPHGRRAREDPSGVEPPDLYIVPVAEVARFHRGEDPSGFRFLITDIDGYGRFCGAWSLIREFLGMESA